MVPLTVLSLLVVTASASLAKDWPLVRGNPQGTGVVPSKLPDPLRVLWKKQLTSGIEATAVIAEDVPEHVPRALRELEEAQ